MERLNKTVEESRQIAEKTDYEIIVWDPFIFSGAMRELERIMQSVFKKSVRFLPLHLEKRGVQDPGESPLKAWSMLPSAIILSGQRASMPPGSTKPI